MSPIFTLALNSYVYDRIVYALFLSSLPYEIHDLPVLHLITLTACKQSNQVTQYTVYFPASYEPTFCELIGKLLAQSILMLIQCTHLYHPGHKFSSSVVKLRTRHAMVTGDPLKSKFSLHVALASQSCLADCILLHGNVLTVG
jgi:hypothetical protein